MTSRPILIAGAGIAGHALALALSLRGIPSQILERNDKLSEAGAGIQLGPNAMHVLQRLGVAEFLEPMAGAPNSIEVMDGASGRRLTSFPLGDDMSRRYGAPYRVAHRADLQAALAGAASKRDDIELITGFEVERFEENDSGITVTAGHGGTAHGDMLIGADGLWSKVRRQMFAAHPLPYSGKLAARAVISTRSVADRFRKRATGVWLAPQAHVVHYPVRGGEEIAIVVITEEASAREGWGSDISSTAVLARLIGFAPDLMAFLGIAHEWRAWSLFDPPPLEAWSRGRVCLIGDAAHPILPFFAQGGGMAIEDAETLAGLIAANRDAPAMAFGRFETIRKARLRRVQEASRANGETFHLDGAMAVARNATLSLVPGRLMMRRYDWLYGWNGDPT